MSTLQTWFVRARNFADADAVRQVHSHLLPFRTVAVRMLGDYHASFDAFYETFYDLLRTASYDATRPLEPYFIRALQNKCRRYLAGTARRQRYEAEAARIIHELQQESMREAIHALYRKEIDEAVRRLPPIDAQAIDLFYRQGLTLAAMATTLQISEAGVRKRLFRIRTKLHRDLAPYREAMRDLHKDPLVSARRVAELAGLL